MPQKYFIAAADSYSLEHLDTRCLQSLHGRRQGMHPNHRVMHVTDEVGGRLWSAAPVVELMAGCISRDVNLHSSSRTQGRAVGCGRGGDNCFTGSGSQRQPSVCFADGAGGRAVATSARQQPAAIGAAASPACASAGGDGSFQERKGVKST